MALFRTLKRKGLTLVELLIVIGIIAVLAGILYIALAPAREKARLMHCISNFRQIYLALESYRQDWGGVDVETANKLADLCLPPRPCWVVNNFPFNRVECIGSLEIWKCSTPLLRTIGSDYGYSLLLYYDNPKNAKYEDERFLKRKDRYIIVTDRNHDPDGGFAGGYLFILLLRLNGSIETKRIVLPVGKPWDIQDE